MTRKTTGTNRPQGRQLGVRVKTASKRSLSSTLWLERQLNDPYVAVVLLGDFLAEDAPDRLLAALDGPADLVLSDMAAPTTGHPRTDHLRIMALAETAYDFASRVLSPGGAFVAKVFQGGAERELLDRLKRDFAQVRHAKPPASRADSSETYVVATGFRGAANPAS